jgi:hypothetical protein
MNLTPIIRQLPLADFDKMLKACRTRSEYFGLSVARHDPGFELHIDLPGPPPQQHGAVAGDPEDDGVTEPQSWTRWLHNEKRFPRD